MASSREAEQYLTDLLNQIEHWLKHPVEIVLFFFGLLNAGVEFSSIGDATWLVLAGFWSANRWASSLFGWIAARPDASGPAAGHADRRPDRHRLCGGHRLYRVAVRRLGRLRCRAVQDAAKMGALFSFAAAVISIIAGKLLRVEKQTG